MMDLYQAFLAQKRDAELRTRRLEHLFWDREPRSPWYADLWRRLRTPRRQRPRSRAGHPSRPSWTIHLDQPHGKTSA